MKQRKPIPKKRKTPRNIHSERSGGHLRVRLHGKAREARRAEIFARAGNYCEEIIRCPLPECNEGGKAWHVYRCPNPATEWSHARHGSNKCDCLDPRCSIASCTDCHKRRHAGGNGKPCPRKAKV